MRNIIWLAAVMIFMVGTGFSEERWIDYGDGIRFKWSEPETAATKKGDELARMRIAIESQPPDYSGTVITGLSWAERELIEAKVEYLRNAGKINIYQGGGGFVTDRHGQNKRSKSGHGRGRR